MTSSTDDVAQKTMEQLLEDGTPRLAEGRPLTLRGRFGVDIVEAGGPEPGVGCAGRGISLMLETFQARKLLENGRYEVVVFDILGDVVCGGFATPIRRGFGKKVFIVVSEELMSLYAANNIAKAVRSYRDGGVVLAGLVANVRDPEADPRPIARFAARIGTKVVASIPRDPAVREAEYRRRSVVEHAPRSPAAKALVRLSALALRLDPRRIPVPSPLEDRVFYELSLHGFRHPKETHR